MDGDGAGGRVVDSNGTANVLSASSRRVLLMERREASGRRRSVCSQVISLEAVSKDKQLSTASCSSENGWAIVDT